MRAGLTYANVMATVAVFLALGGGALAATSLIGSDGKIRGCVSKSGALRVLKPGKHCGKGTTKITWNQTGPQGPPATNAAHANTADSATNAGNADKLDNQDSTAFALRGAEPWQAATLNDGAGGQACRWLNYGGSQNPAGYFRDRAGVIHLRGLVKAVDDGLTFSCGDITDDPKVFSLPAGYRPDHDWTFATISNDKPGRANVNPAGVVFIRDGFPTWPDAKQWVSLDGLTFRCAPSGQDGCP
jgi:hypothetical protein